MQHSHRLLLKLFSELLPLPHQCQPDFSLKKKKKNILFSGLTDSEAPTPKYAPTPSCSLHFPFTQPAEAFKQKTRHQTNTKTQKRNHWLSSKTFSGNADSGADAAGGARSDAGDRGADGALGARSGKRLAFGAGFQRAAAQIHFRLGCAARSGPRARRAGRVAANQSSCKQTIQKAKPKLNGAHPCTRRCLAPARLQTPLPTLERAASRSSSRHSPKRKEKRKKKKNNKNKGTNLCVSASSHTRRDTAAGFQIPLLE
jgi:hypothetical protein